MNTPDALSYYRTMDHRRERVAVFEENLTEFMSGLPNPISLEVLKDDRTYYIRSLDPIDAVGTQSEETP